jgi:hypothetical protein
MTLQRRLDRLAHRTPKRDPADVLADARARAWGRPDPAGRSRMLVAAVVLAVLVVGVGALVLGGNGDGEDRDGVLADQGGSDRSDGAPLEDDRSPGRTDAGDDMDPDPDRSSQGAQDHRSGDPSAGDLAQWTGVYAAHGTLQMRRGALVNEAPVPEYFSLDWTSDSASILTLFGRMSAPWSDSGLGFTLSFDSRGADLLRSIRVIRPILSDPGGTNTIGFPFESPIAWLEGDVAGGEDRRASDSNYVVTMRRTDTAAWEFLIERSATSDEQAFPLDEGRLTITADRPHPPWDRFEIGWHALERGWTTDASVSFTRSDLSMADLIERGRTP